ncbi:MAG TPA: cyclic nucleotide-binding domain-containing protein [Thermoanaerobaculia bacterium]|jgi:CRP/FNR family cyclic AMP-dependent transcriptional regulator|nr:cyclic nucleotide-binding domain-containing protein [Thermoanaerobaculia bacterium]
MAIFDLLQREPDVRAFRAGETVFTEGDPGDCMFAVIEGEVAIQKNGIILERVGVGGVFGEMSLIDHAPRSATAVATVDCRVAAVAQKRFTFLVQQTPYFALEIMHVLAERLRRNTAS